MADMAVIYFRPDATESYDMEFDAQRLGGHDDAPRLAPQTSDGTDVTIDALNFAGKNTIVPVDFSDNALSGTFNLTATKLETFRSGTGIMLEDKKTGKTQDLMSNPAYEFSYNTGDDPGRFLLHFYNPFFSLDKLSGNDFLAIYSDRNTVYIKDLSGNPESGEVIVYNLMGKEVLRRPLEISSLNRITLNVAPGYYIVQVISGNRTTHGKVYLN
jgi:hypothetical protein